MFMTNTRPFKGFHSGPECDIIFRQTPEPGYMAQSDFTHVDDIVRTNLLEAGRVVS